MFKKILAANRSARAFGAVPLLRVAIHRGGRDV
jgi:hypothetical protein